jgi:hypothetical protein
MLKSVSFWKNLRADGLCKGKKKDEEVLTMIRQQYYSLPLGTTLHPDRTGAVIGGQPAMHQIA